MRQIGTLTDPDAARQFADYLLARQIETRLLEEGAAWGIWVCNEDQLPQARQEFAAFQSNPNDPRYAEAARAAQELRAREDDAEETYRKNQVDLRERFEQTSVPRLTLALMLASFGVTLGAGTLLEGLSDKDAEPRNAVFQAVLIQPAQPPDFGSGGLSAVARGEVWRLVTPIFLHFGLIHLLFNMMMLRDLGSAVELRRGPARFLLLVLAIAVPSNLAQYYLGQLGWTGTLGPPSPLFGGMSGVVYGLFGYVWMKSRYAPELGLGMDPSTVVLMVGWFFLCMTPLISSVANMAHGVGLLVGLVLGAGPHLLRFERET